MMIQFPARFTLLSIVFSCFGLCESAFSQAIIPPLRPSFIQDVWLESTPNNLDVEARAKYDVPPGVNSIFLDSNTINLATKDISGDHVLAGHVGGNSFVLPFFGFVPTSIFPVTGAWVSVNNYHTVFIPESSWNATYIQDVEAAFHVNGDLYYRPYVVAAETIGTAPFVVIWKKDGTPVVIGGYLANPNETRFLAMGIEKINAGEVGDYIHPNGKLKFTIFGPTSDFDFEVMPAPAAGGGGGGGF